MSKVKHLGHDPCDVCNFIEEDYTRAKDERDNIIDGYLGNKSANKHIKLQSLVGYAWHQADQACARPKITNRFLRMPDIERCAVAAKGDASWMCHTCWARHITYGPLCEKCSVNHRGDCQ